MRQRKRPGKRERQARKRHRRARVWSSTWGASVGWLKVGRSHSGRQLRRYVSVMAVADAEQLAKGAKEADTQHQPGQDWPAPNLLRRGDE